MAKASVPDQSLSIGLTALVKDALIRHHGSLKAAAIDMRMDQGQLTRELQTGDFKLKRLEGTDGQAQILAVLGRELVEQFAPLVDPKEEARRALADLERARDVLKQFVEDVA